MSISTFKTNNSSVIRIGNLVNFCFDPILYLHNLNDNQNEHGKLILEPSYSQIPLLYIT